MPKPQTLEQRFWLKKCAVDSRIFPKFPASCDNSGQHNGPSEEPEIIFADMLRARMVFGSEVTLVGDKSIELVTFVTKTNQSALCETTHSCTAVSLASACTVPAQSMVLLSDREAWGDKLINP